MSKDLRSRPDQQKRCGKAAVDQAMRSGSRDFQQLHPLRTEPRNNLSRAEGSIANCDTGHVRGRALLFENRPAY